MQESLGIRMVMGVAAGTALSAGISYEQAWADDATAQAESGASTEQQYEVTGGETAEGIALRYGVTEAEIIASNPGVDFSLLQPGQHVVVPSSVNSEPVQVAQQQTTDSVSLPNGYDVVVTSGNLPTSDAVNAGVTNAVVPQPSTPITSFTDLPFNNKKCCLYIAASVKKRHLLYSTPLRHK